MKLLIYDPDKVGYVSLNPYEWKYDGRYEDVYYFLDRNIQPLEHKGYRSDDGTIEEVEEVITDEEKHLRRISFTLNEYGVLTKIIDE